MIRLLFVFGFALLIQSAEAFQIVVDYTYDTNNFFNTQERRDAMQAAADRFSRIITSSLNAVDASYMDGDDDWRIGFTHPGTGAGFQISTAASAASDSIVSANGPPADLYAPTFILPQNTWLLFAGGRAGLGSSGEGGTGTGLNFTSVFADAQGPLHRGAISETPAATTADLPAWGGSVTFDSDEDWHFNLATAGPTSTVDFYSIALHEVGHALGLSTSWNQWRDSGSSYVGSRGVAAYNTDNGTALSSLNLASSGNPHWQDGAYDSYIFSAGSPNLAGTVGLGARQDLLMEPTANFTGTLRRFELTNVDVAALRDIGWTVVPEPSTALLLAQTVLLMARRRRSFRAG